MSLPSISKREFHDILRQCNSCNFCGGRSCLFPLLTCNLICVPCILRHIESYQETYLVDPNGSHLSWALVPCAEARLHSSRGSWISFQFRLLHPLRSYGSRRLSSRDPQRRFSTNRETFKKIEKCKSSESKQFESRTKKSWVTGNDLVSNPRKQRFTKP